MAQMRTRNELPKQGPVEAYPRRGNVRAVSDDVLAGTSGLFQRAGFTEPSLILRWQEIAGPEVANLATPLRLREGPDGAILTILAESAAAVFLQHQTRALVDRLNGFLGKGRIALIRIVPGAIERMASPAEHPLKGARLRPQTSSQHTLGQALERLGNLRSIARTNRGLTD